MKDAPGAVDSLQKKMALFVYTLTKEN